MKKFLILFFLCCTSLYVDAKDNTKLYEKLIHTYDVGASCLVAQDAGTFWDGVWRNNVRFSKFMEAVRKGTPAVKKAFRGLSEAREANAKLSSVFEIIATNKDSLLMPLYNELGAAKVTKDIKLFLVREEEMNAFACPDGEIYIYTGLLGDSVDFAEVLGACAHEMAHYVLQHVYVHAYTIAKREKRNEIYSAIAGGVRVAAAGYAEANGAHQDWKAVNKDIKNLFLSALIDTNKFGYKYSREQEIEADIIAFRFLEAMGYGGEKYIRLLEEIEKNAPSITTSETDNHPSITFRIGLLRYMANHIETNLTE